MEVDYLAVRRTTLEVVTKYSDASRKPRIQQYIVLIFKNYVVLKRQGEYERTIK